MLTCIDFLSKISPADQITLIAMCRSPSIMKYVTIGLLHHAQANNSKWLLEKWAVMCVLHCSTVIYKLVFYSFVRHKPY